MRPVVTARYSQSVRKVAKLHSLSHCRCSAHGLRTHHRTDSAGVLLWEKSYGGASYDWLNSIKVTTDGGVIMCGFVYNNGGDITVNIGAIDIWIVKTDTSGNIEWEKSYGGTGNDWGFAITQSSDGGYAFATVNYLQNQVLRSSNHVHHANL